MVLDDNPNLSGAEKRALLKEQYKKEMLEDQALRKKLQLSNQISKHNQQIDQALQAMEGMSADDTDDLIHKLNYESSLREARLSMALSDAQQKTTKNTDISTRSTTKTLADEESLIEDDSASPTSKNNSEFFIDKTLF